MLSILNISAICCLKLVISHFRPSASLFRDLAIESVLRGAPPSASPSPWGAHGGAPHPAHPPAPPPVLGAPWGSWWGSASPSSWVSASPSASPQCMGECFTQRSRARATSAHRTPSADRMPPSAAKSNPQVARFPLVVVPNTRFFVPWCLGVEILSGFGLDTPLFSATTVSSWQGYRNHWEEQCEGYY